MIVFVLTYYILFHYVLLLSPEILVFFLLRDGKGMEPEERGDREEQEEGGETKTGI